MQTNDSLVPAQNGHLIGLAFEGKSVRILEREGEPWFLSNDVGEALDLTSIRDWVYKLDEDQKLSLRNDSFEGMRANTTFISESGLYELIFRSSKPEAKRFRKWVTGEVLPQIRKTGGFTSVGMPEPDITLRLAHLNAEIIAELGSQGTRIRELEGHMRPGPEWLGVTEWMRVRGIPANRGRIAKLSAAATHKSAVLNLPVGRRKTNPKGGSEHRTFSPLALDEVGNPMAARWARKDAAAATQTPELPLP